MATNPSATQNASAPSPAAPAPAAPAAAASTPTADAAPAPVSQLAALAGALATEQVVDVSGLKDGTTVLIRAKYGLMINPLNEDRFDTDTVSKVKVDFWLRGQIAAGKLLVETI